MKSINYKRILGIVILIALASGFLWMLILTNGLIPTLCAIMFSVLFLLAILLGLYLIMD
jgi:H+/Cl- antiporter ClcA